MLSRIPYLVRRQRPPTTSSSVVTTAAAATSKKEGESTTVLFCNHQQEQDDGRSSSSSSSSISSVKTNNPTTTVAQVQPLLHSLTSSTSFFKFHYNNNNDDNESSQSLSPFASSLAPHFLPPPPPHHRHHHEQQMLFARIVQELAAATMDRSKDVAAAPTDVYLCSSEQLGNHIQMCLGAAATAASPPIVAAMTLELLCRKLVLLRERSFSTSPPALSASCVEKVLFSARPAAVLPVAIGILSSTCASVEDVACVLTRVRDFETQEHRRNVTRVGSNAALSDNARSGIARVVELARQRLRDHHNNRNKNISSRKQQLQEQTQDDPVVRHCIDQLYSLSIFVHFSDCAHQLLQISQLVSDLGIHLTAPDLAMKACYVASVLSRRPSCGEEVKRQLITVLEQQCENLLAMIMTMTANSSSVDHTTSSDRKNKMVAIGGALRHALIAIMMLNKPDAVLKVVLAIREQRKISCGGNRSRNNNDDDDDDDDDDLVLPVAATNQNDDSRQQSAAPDRLHCWKDLFAVEHCWPVAWAHAKATSNVDAALTILKNHVARSRHSKGGWKGVPSRMRHVFYSVGSSVTTAEQLEKWCESVCAMRCPSLRVDAEVVVQTMLALERRVSKTSTTSQEVVVRHLARIVAASGLFQTDASRVIEHLVEHVGLEKVACDIVVTWRGVVRRGYHHKSSGTIHNTADGDNTHQQHLLDAQLLQVLLGIKHRYHNMDDDHRDDHHRHHHHHDNSTASSSPPVWLKHIFRFPSLLLPGALPDHIACLVHKHIISYHDFLVSSRLEVPLVRALRKLSQQITSTNNSRVKKNSTTTESSNAVLTTTASAAAVWTCTLCSTSNTFVHSTCGNDECRAARFAPVQCGECRFINPSSATHCQVCRADFSSSSASSTSSKKRKNNSFTPLPFAKWVCVTCNTTNIPSPSVTSGLRCESCAGMTGPLSKHVDMIPPESVRCDACQTTPEQGSVLSSQDPACPLCVEHVGGGVLVPITQSSGGGGGGSLLLTGATTTEGAQLHHQQHRTWLCPECNSWNPLFRERCVRCVHVSRFELPTRAVSQEEGDEEKYLIENGSLVSVEEQQEEIVPLGFWSCTCGAPMNSTEADVCASCGGSVEMNCAAMFTASASASSASSFVPQQQQLGRSNKKNKSIMSKRLSMCGECGEQSFACLLLAAKNGDSSSSTSSLSKQQHLGDFCVNPSCGALLPLASKIIDVQHELEEEEEQQHDEGNNSFLTSSRSRHNNENSSNDNVRRQISSPCQTDFFASLNFRTISLEHNLLHLYKLMTTTNTKTTTVALMNDEASTAAADHIIHRLVRACAQRLVHDRDLASQFRSAIHPTTAAALEKIVIDILAWALSKWDLFSPSKDSSFNRMSLAAALRIGDALLLPAAAAQQEKRQPVEEGSSRRPRFSRSVEAFFSQHQRVLGHIASCRCRWCLGRHSEELCPHNQDPNFSPTWACGDCGEVANDIREGAQRYVCKSCLGLRPEVLNMQDDALWAEVWECPSCRRATPMLEDGCIFCPFIRHEEEDDGGGGGATCSNVIDKNHKKDNYSSSSSINVFPFFPARCGLCGEVHFEALCPVCSRIDCCSSSHEMAITMDSPGKRNVIQNAFGVVSSLIHRRGSSKFTRGQQQEEDDRSNTDSSNSGGDDDFVVATVQPHGTAGKRTAVLVPASVLFSAVQDTRTIGALAVGSAVRFDAKRSNVIKSMQQYEKGDKNRRGEAGDVFTTTSALTATSIAVLQRS